MPFTKIFQQNFWHFAPSYASSNSTANFFNEIVQNSNSRNLDSQNISTIQYTDLVHKYSNVAVMQAKDASKEISESSGGGGKDKVSSHAATTYYKLNIVGAGFGVLLGCCTRTHTHTHTHTQGCCCHQLCWQPEEVQREEKEESSSVLVRQNFMVTFPLFPSLYFLPPYLPPSPFCSVQSGIVPPWVGEHPDVFDDPNFSITALESTQAEDSMMDISLGSPQLAALQPLKEKGPLQAGEERRGIGNGGGGVGYLPKEVLLEEEEPMSIAGKKEGPIGEHMPV